MCMKKSEKMRVREISMSWNCILNQCYPPTACMLCALQMPQTEANYIFREKKKTGENKVLEGDRKMINTQSSLHENVYV